ncbi:MAG: HlyD family efflux transporter periplasmic adaptor subunit [Oscillatoriophycideae cyanobacterium NC_groundwater_1537_Pr4_S-0.65um_50_18]|nr:HlyD family efflux transporter periplasmic adaptor subunit [Oscillatoriophycideae cyanobacterium NC_groundwater_1537_Pr4_S-0.65um_50_18]
MSLSNPDQSLNHRNRNGHGSSNQTLDPELPAFEPPVVVADSSPPLAKLSSSDVLAKDPKSEWSSLTQELVDGLPQVWTRGLLYLLMGFIGIVLPWAMLAKVDQTGVARGRLEPQGQIYRIDASVTGEVIAINVQQGGAVKAGQTLVKLESALVQTDLQQTQAKLEGQLNRLTQLEQIKSQLAIATRTQRLQSQAQISEQEAQIDQVKQKLVANQQAYTLAQSRLVQDLKEVDRYRHLWQIGAGSEVKIVEMERIAKESQQLMEQAQAEIRQTQSELAKQQSTHVRIARTGELAILDSQKQSEELQTQLADLQAEIAQTQKLITSLQLQTQQRTIRSPVDGTIFQLPLQKPGAVIQSGQMVAQIAPKGAALIFKAQMPSSETGFLQLGMPVKLKFDAYPFQDYGVVSGHLHWISPDSKTIQTQQGEIEMFEVEIVLDQLYIQDHEKPVALTPGQTATAEVVIRQRRIIDFVLDPFRKLQHGEFKL